MLQKIAPSFKCNKPDKMEQIKSEECAICLEDWKFDPEVRKLTCGHHFHKMCIDSWLIKHYNCPLDRQSFLYTEIKEIKREMDEEKKKEKERIREEKRLSRIQEKESKKNNNNQNNSSQ